MAIITGPPTVSVSGASFTGAAEALEIISNHAYAFSGQLGANTSAVTHFQFTSGNYYFVGDLTVNGATSIGSPSNGRTTVWDLSFNGAVVANLKTDSAAADFSTNPAVNAILIPPYTEVKLVAVSDATSGDRLTSAVITGRIYRG